MDKAPPPIFTFTHDGTGLMYPTYRSRVSVTLQYVNVTVVGRGITKKAAKHDAARLALEKLSDMKVLQSVLEAKKREQQTSSKTNYAAVRQLQHFCRKEIILQPKFNLVAEMGPLYAKEYAIECSVGEEFKETATASTKRVAKRLAAHKMLETLREIERSIERS
ncbi:interferon-inducible double-stranded RNA-dependent protein kinase activator A homolog [Ctenocephalides felis]|uniref:interferon-inducible double-stranded RNA-dependent protein kinase activator A homolog n=1 Tax=Ctenocephalides felis TaxID=7515 RepID=UPI000E6E12EA|nr:interferon-inducible double-stranded RNA-dependent protein kinase activator A homolog [Ctenocephalides felis]